MVLEQIANLSACDEQASGFKSQSFHQVYVRV